MFCWKNGNSFSKIARKLSCDNFTVQETKLVYLLYPGVASASFIQKSLVGKFIVNDCFIA